MKIKRLVIENFKSIERIELIEPNPFTVFVGPNGSGKSNIFEALEFHIPNESITNKLRLFGGSSYLQRRQRESDSYSFISESDHFEKHRNGSFLTLKELDSNPGMITDIQFISNKDNEANYRLLANGFSRIFVRNERLQKQNYIDDSRLNLSCSNLEKVLRRLLTNGTFKDELFEWLELFIPGFKAVEIDDRDELHWFEEFAPNYFTKELISDGTYNILAMLTAMYQSDEPQFLCIEEPENGLNPKVVKELVNLCRYAYEEFGHHIWLNTHSQTLVSQLTPDEIVLVDKKDGATQIKQIKGMNLHDLPMDEAWLSNALGGGLPW